MFIAYESLCTYTEGMFDCLCYNCFIVNFVLCTLLFQEEHEYTKNLLSIIFSGEIEEER